MTRCAVLLLSLFAALNAHADAPLLTPHWGHSARVLPNGKVLVVGGFGNSAAGATGNPELYDPASDSWSPAGALATPRVEEAVTFLSDGRLLAVGGVAVKGGAYLASAEIYD